MKHIAFILFSVLAAAAAGEGNPDIWARSVRHSVDFFNQHAWDEASGSYASEIGVDGSRKSETRHLIALSRMVYGLAHGSAVDAAYLDRARRGAKFIIEKMTRRDALGTYFVSAVDAQGNVVTDKPVLVVNEQAYGLNGLVALYRVTKDPELLARIREIYASFHRRFHDAELGGFYDGFELATGTPVRTKSYNSTVYVATSFLLELASADTERRPAYEAVVRELADLVAAKFPDPRTGWIVENFTRGWTPDWRDWQKQGESTIGIVGHNFQAAWFLMRAAEAADPTSAASYRNVARTLLTSMLDKGAVDWERGGFFDAFKRESSEPMWNTNKAWWQQAEAILALTLAEKTGVLTTEKAALARRKGLEFYFGHFVDYRRGGEFDTVDKDGNPTPDAVKGSLGKSVYHTVELARYMREYSAAPKAPVMTRADLPSCKHLLAGIL